MNRATLSDQIVLVDSAGGELDPASRRYAIQQSGSNTGQGGPHHSVDGRVIQRSVFSVEELLGYIRKYGILAGILGLIAGVGLYVYIQSLEPVYESTAVVLLNPTHGKQLNLQTMQEEDQSEYTLPQLVNNMSNEISSDKFRLSLYQVIDVDLRNEIIGTIGEDEQAMEEKNVFLERLSQQINIDVIKDSHMVSVTAKNPDKHVASKLANAYVEYFAKYIREQELETTRKVAFFLKSKAKDLLVRVQELENELIAYREKEGIIAGSADSEFAVNKVNDLNRQLTEAKLARENLAETLEIIAASGEDSEDLLKATSLAQNVVLERAYEQLTTARTDLETLSIDFGKKHPRMIVAMNKERAALENLDKLVTQAIGSLKKQLRTSTSKVASLETKLVQAKQEVKFASNKSVSHQLKEEQLKSGRELYNSLLSQMHEADIALQFNGAERVRITEQAISQRTPVFPRKSLSAVLGVIAFGGCFFGVPLTLGLGTRIWAIGRESDHLQSAALTSEHAVSSELLYQPAPEAPAFTQANQTSEPLNYPTLVTFPRGDTGQPRDWVRLASAPNSRSGIELNAYLTRLMSEPSQARGLIVTSNHTNPVKTLSAAALALAASRRGLRTLLVSSEKLTPAMAPAQGGHRVTQPKPAEELLAPFTTEEEKLYFITDEAWKRIPALCMETLTNAHYCVDLLVMDAPPTSSERDLALMSNFAASILFVRDSGESYSHKNQQMCFQRILPNCSVAGEFVAES